MSAVLAPFVAAATEEEVGCLWSLGQGAYRLEGVLSALQSPTVPVPGRSRGLGRQKGTSPGAIRVLSKAWAQGRGPSVRDVSGGSLPLGCPGSGFRVGLTSLLCVARPAWPCLQGEQHLGSGIGQLTRLSTAQAG